MSDETFTLENITSKISEKVEGKAQINASFKFDLRGEGFIHIDGTQSPIQVSNDDKPADCTIRIAPADLAKLYRGKLNPMTALMTGKIKVDNMTVAPKLMSLLSS